MPQYEFLEYDLRLLLSLVIAALLSAIIGIDRESSNKPAGLRTHMLVGMGAALFVALGRLVMDFFAPGGDAVGYDPLRILEAVVAGVAFLGAGTIFFSRGDHVVKGLTTAASLWVTAGVGMAAALEHYLLATGAALLSVLILQLLHLEKKLPDKDSPHD